MTNKFDDKIAEILDDIIAIRRDLHTHPELALEETRTSHIVYEELVKLGLQVIKNVGKTGVVGLLKTGRPGKTLLIRADMDALPIKESSGVAFASQNPGVMHACGHDMHTSILLGTAKVLTSMKDELQGNIKFCFQPAEEDAPTGGANYMIADGLLENPTVDAAIAMHVWETPLGTVSLRYGAMMAQSDRILVTVRGKSSHGSMPHQGKDAIVAGGQVISALQSIVSRNVSPLDSAVVTIGTITGGYRYNVVADEVVMEGTVRTFLPHVSDMMPGTIKRVVENTAAAFGCVGEVEYITGYPSTVNDNDLAAICEKGLQGVFPAENVLIPADPAPGGEDFSFFGQHVPICYMWLGMKSDRNADNMILHNPDLICDERAIPIGIKGFAAIAFEYLNNH